MPVLVRPSWNENLLAVLYHAYHVYHVSLIFALIVFAFDIPLEKVLTLNHFLKSVFTRSFEYVVPQISYSFSVSSPGFWSVGTLAHRWAHSGVLKGLPKEIL